tara:strand:+ start:120 stop:269 length:150 start_codon:yes stop_codon:yes gene_type:complete
MKKKQEIKNIKKGEIDLVIPTPDDVQNYIDNKVLELKTKKDGMQLWQEN